MKNEISRCRCAALLSSCSRLLAIIMISLWSMITSAAAPVKIIDVMDAAYLPSMQGIVVGGRNGFVGLAKIDGDVLNIEQIEGQVSEDITVVAQLSDHQVLLGGSHGGIFLFDSEGIKKVAMLSEYQEPVLDIGITKGDIWAVGARGLLARSHDGINWEPFEILQIQQPPIRLKNLGVGELYFGVANIDLDSISLDATVGGRKVVIDEDYAFYSEEGFMDIFSRFDDVTAAEISFSFAPGPPYRRGDVSWNAVVVRNETIILAGEFGYIIRSMDAGENWERMAAVVEDHEPQAPYWLAGHSFDETIFLVGAAGAITRSNDGGATWETINPPNEEGIFGVTRTPAGKMLILGAVGLAGIESEGGWILADRTKLQLRSWLKTAVQLPDGSLICLGGRSTALRYQLDKWAILNLSLK